MLQDLFLIGLGALAAGKEKAEELVEYLVEKGEMQRDEARKLINLVLEKGAREKEHYWSQVKEKIDSTIKEKVITKEDFLRLEAKVDRLLALSQENEQ